MARRLVNAVRIPGFMTETPSGVMSVGSRQSASYGSGREIIPALPPGGYACLAVAAACHRGDEEACKSVKTECRPYPGQTCGVQQSGSVYLTKTNPNTGITYITGYLNIPSVLACEGNVYVL
jgi:hypothetical protein